MGQNFHKIEAVRLEGGDPFFLITSLKETIPKQEGQVFNNKKTFFLSKLSNCVPPLVPLIA